eukprot:477632-Rhodomonas_salina.1
MGRSCTFRLEELAFELVAQAAVLAVSMMQQHCLQPINAAFPTINLSDPRQVLRLRRRAAHVRHASEDSLKAAARGPGEE